jgi:hypothetical protein
MTKEEPELYEEHIQKNRNNKLLIVYTENQILIKENSKLKEQNKKIELENNILKNQLREIDNYCKHAMNCL